MIMSLCDGVRLKMLVFEESSEQRADFRVVETTERDGSLGWLDRPACSGDFVSEAIVLPASAHIAPQAQPAHCGEDTDSPDMPRFLIQP